MSVFLLLLLLLCVPYAEAASSTITTTAPEDAMLAIQVERHGQPVVQIMGSACSAGLAALHQSYHQADDQAMVEALQQMSPAERKAVRDLINTQRLQREQQGQC